MKPLENRGVQTYVHHKPYEVASHGYLWLGGSGNVGLKAAQPLFPAINCVVGFSIPPRWMPKFSFDIILTYFSNSPGPGCQMCRCSPTIDYITHNSLITLILIYISLGQYWLHQGCDAFRSLWRWVLQQWTPFIKEIPSLQNKNKGPRNDDWYLTSGQSSEDTLTRLVTT